MSAFIERLHARNFRQFKQLDVRFNPGFNFISGPNGSGKTSILACISHCFNYHNLEYSRFTEASEFWSDISVSEKKIRVGLGENSIGVGSYRQNKVNNWGAPPSTAGRISLSVTQHTRESDGFCPLFIGAQRSIKYARIEGVRREAAQDQRVTDYYNSSTQSLYGDKPIEIKQWLINRYFMIDKDWAEEERSNWLRMVASLPSIGPFDSNFSYVKTERDLEPVFSIYGKECYLEELSAGFQAVLLIIANIFEWVEGTRPAGKRVAAHAEGTVLIDELDLHLHPEWQFTLRDGLARIFPRLQFIVTTHSPHLLSSARENEVIIVPGGQEEAIYDLSPAGRKFSGWNTDQILSEIMGVRSLENKDHERLINNAFREIENRSIEGLKKAIGELELVSHPSDSIVIVLQARLASMVATAND